MSGVSELGKLMGAVAPRFRILLFTTHNLRSYITEKKILSPATLVFNEAVRERKLPWHRPLESVGSGATPHG